MEPITTSAMIGTVVGYLAMKLKDDKSVQGLFNDFTGAAVKWIRPIFLTDDDTPKDILQDLQADPEDKLNTDALENAIAKALKKEPAAETHLKDMYEVLQQKAGKGESISIVGSKNVNLGNIQAGGNVSIGDTTVHQSHTGSGDNIGRDKIINSPK